MSYDITMNDPVTKEPIQLDTPHQMRPDGVWDGD